MFVSVVVVAVVVCVCVCVCVCVRACMNVHMSYTNVSPKFACRVYDLYLLKVTWSASDSDVCVCVFVSVW